MGDTRIHCSHEREGRRRRFAGVLALLWGLYALAGASGLCRVACAQSSLPHTHAPTVPAPACHCLMCHGTTRQGKRLCCCKTADTPQQQAVITSRCDRGAPAVLAAATSWPVIRPGAALVILLQHSAPRFIPAENYSAFSFLLPPITQPPILL